MSFSRVIQSRTFVTLFVAYVLFSQTAGAQVIKPVFDIWYNSGSFSSKSLYEEKKIRHKSLSESNQAAYDYLMYAYYNHYLMLEESQRLHYMITGTEMNKYLEGLVAQIQQKNSLIISRSRKYSVLILKSSDPNAFAFGDGILGVSTGLLARLDKEEELISILSHEISHDVLGHNEETMLKHAYMYTDGTIGDSIDYILEEGAYNRTRMEAYLAKIYSGSMKKNRQNELEADSLGLILFTNCGYEKTHAVNALKKLKLTWLDHKDFSLFSYFSDLNIPYPDHWVYRGDDSRLKDLVDTEFDFLDTISSHPDQGTRLRRLEIIDSLRGMQSVSAEGGDYYQIKFNSLVQLCLMNHQNSDPALTLYYALLLKKFEPNQTFSDNMMLISVCKAAFLKQGLKLTMAIGTTDTSYEWSYNQIIFMMKKMKYSELSNLICTWSEKIEAKNTLELYSFTSTLYSGFFCMKLDKYNYLRNKYIELYKNAFFKNDLIYLPKKRK